MIVLGRLGGREASGRVVDGMLDDLLVAPADGAPPPGTVFRAQAGRPMKGQGGLFLDLPGGGRAYLRGGRGIAPGSTLVVQVTGYGEPGKAVPVTTRLALRGRYAVATPGAPGLNVSRRIGDDDARAAVLGTASEMSGALPEGCGLVLRSLSAEADEGEVRDDIADVAAAAGALEGASAPPARLLDGPGPHRAAWIDWGFADRVVEGADAFARADMLDAVAAALVPEQALSGGAAMIVEPTRALVAVDVNTGADTSPAAGLKANLAAIAALPRALRLRGLGGQVVVDAAPMGKADRSRVEAALARALKGDPVPTTIAGWTPLGHMELQRRRLRAPFDGPLE